MPFGTALLLLVLDALAVGALFGYALGRIAR